MGNSYIMVIALVFALTLYAKTTMSIDCNTAIQDLFSCQNFLFGDDQNPSFDCCQGVTDVAGIANSSKANFQTVCECLKQAAQNLPIDLPKAQHLPNLCHISLNITIDPNIDCSRV